MTTPSHSLSSGRSAEIANELRRRHQVVAAKSSHVGRLGRLRRRAAGLVSPQPAIRIAYA
jgi:hypothetical protein